MPKNAIPVQLGIERHVSRVNGGLAGQIVVKAADQSRDMAQTSKTCVHCAGTGVAHVAWSKDVGAFVVRCVHCRSTSTGSIADVVCACLCGALSLLLLSAIWLR